MVHWLTPGKKTAQQMGEAIVVEQFCHVVGAETQAWIRRHNPDTLEEAVKLAEDFEDSLTSARIGILSAPALRSSRPLSPSPPSPSPPSFPGPRPPRAPIPLGPLASPPWRPGVAPSWGRGAAPAPLPYQQRDRFITHAPSVPPICFRCHQPGHLARSCPAAMECDVAACNWAPETAAANGIVLNLELYQGIDILLAMLGNATGDQKTNQGQYVVARLTAQLERGTCVYFDRFFTPLKLADFLLPMGLFCTGTLMRNRLPKKNCLVQKILKERGADQQMVMVLRNDGEVAIIKWYDKKEILFASIELQYVQDCEYFDVVKKCIMDLLDFRRYVGECGKVVSEYRPAMQPPQSYSVGGQRSSGQLTGKPAGAQPLYRGVAKWLVRAQV
ncbi:UNVERIFIED_CONTAM: hypothetical protein FKN15_007271 [Acipenser sinensis]